MSSSPIDPFSTRFIEVSIASGALDEELDHIESALNRRRALLASEKISELSVGDKITISHNVRPKLLGGLTCRVTGFQGTDKVEVILLESSGSSKWYRGKTIILPKSIIGEKVEES